jgi:FkbM family methyltransferase
MKVWLLYLLDARRLRRQIDPLNLFRLVCAERVRRPGAIVRLCLKSLPRPVYVRARSSDCALVRTVLLRDGGDYPVFPGFVPRNIIDAGANIGLATAFFKAHYPEATIVAIEPDEANCRMFERNTRGYAGVHLLRGGVWSDAASRLRIRNADADAYSYQLEEAREGVEAFTIPGICRRFGIERIDILKVDIEGGERALFSRNTEWLGVVDNLFVELHDHHARGASQALLRAVAGQGFFLRFKGENTILTRELRAWRTV